MSKHLVIIAGEESGDAHAAKLIKALQAQDPSLQISGIGGVHMEAAGAKLVTNLARFGVTGISEVLKHFKVIRHAFKAIKKHLKETKPDLLLLVDYPGFNLRLARYAKKRLKLPILYYISPQIWAWKAGRIDTIQKTVDHMAVILPFEKAIYEKAKVPASFVGHPLLKKVQPIEKEVARRKIGLPPAVRILGLLPGSRKNEIERLLPVLVELAQSLHHNYTDLHFALPIAESLDATMIKAFFKDKHLPIHFIEGQALETMAASDFVVVASGTASLECALMAKPMCIIYKASRLTYCIGKLLIKIPYIGLCNILSQTLLVPEFIQNACNAKSLQAHIEPYLDSKELREEMALSLSPLRASLSEKEADTSLDSLVKEILYKE